MENRITSYPYYIVLTGSDEIYRRIKETPGVIRSNNTGKACVVYIEDNAAKVLFELAFGDLIVQQVFE